MTQEQALTILKCGRNVFLTGEPGSGKTYVINRYIEYLNDHGVYPAVTASTGIAATHIDGMTIHSWSGIGISKRLSQDEIRELADKSKLARRIQAAAVLIIDEISMLDSATLDLAEAVVSAIRNNGLPWGGLQVVFVGDFFQLPPVSRAGEDRPTFAFSATSWAKADPVVCYLTEQHRQEDAIFLSLLNGIRRGILTEEIQRHLHSRKVAIESGGGHTKLFTHNADVDRINEEKLRLLPAEEFQFEMHASGRSVLVDQLKRGCLSPETLRLKVGARVMFTKNDFERGFVNGTLGEVVDFIDGAPLVRTTAKRTVLAPVADWKVMDGSRTLARIAQYPLRLAWAITVHKSQGMTLDEAVVDLSSAFEYGQGYVALSRVRNLSSLFLLGWNRRSLEVHPDVLTKDGQFQSASQETEAELSRLSAQDLGLMAETFLTASGGQLDPSKVPAAKAGKKRATRNKRGNTYEETLLLWKQGLGLKEVSGMRGLSESTILSHLEELSGRGLIAKNEFDRVIPEELRNTLPEILKAFAVLENGRLGPVFKHFNGKYSFGQLRLARLLWD